MRGPGLIHPPLHPLPSREGKREGCFLEGASAPRQSRLLIFLLFDRIDWTDRIDLLSIDEID